MSDLDARVKDAENLIGEGVSLYSLGLIRALQADRKRLQGLADKGKKAREQLRMLKRRSRIEKQRGG